MKKKYAKLILKKGINLEQGKSLLITSPIECYEFTKILVKEAYNMGAKKVLVDWIDDELTRMKYEYEEIDNFKSLPSYIIDKNKYMVDNDYSYIKISANNPNGLKGIDSNKLMEFQKTIERELKFKTDVIMSDLASWCVVSVPIYGWAKKVFPNSEDPVNDLWDTILKITRSDKEDPILEWDNHIERLLYTSNILNDKKFDYLIFKNKMGTNLKVKLIKNHLWASAQSINRKTNRYFIANIPTEEVYTIPDRNDINGIVYASKPLNFQGNLIKDFYLEFKDGKVINFDAKEGKEILENLLSIDEGAKSLGEVALVSYNSPISLSNILFYNTLFDENASCHIALGKAYPTNLKDFDKYSEDELLNLGVNDSAIHVDFMFGTSDMEIIGNKDGKEEIIMKNGDIIDWRKNEQVFKEI